MSHPIITIPLHELRAIMLKAAKVERMNGLIHDAEHTLSLRRIISKAAQKQHEKISLNVPPAGKEAARAAIK